MNKRITFNHPPIQINKLTKIYIQILSPMINVARADPARSDPRVDIKPPCTKSARHEIYYVKGFLGKRKQKEMSFCSGTISLMGGKKRMVIDIEGYILKTKREKNRIDGKNCNL